MSYRQRRRVSRWHLLKIHAGVFSKNELGIEAEVAEAEVSAAVVVAVVSAAVVAVVSAAVVAVATTI
jgi:hypothetical protein